MKWFFAAVALILCLWAIVEPAHQQEHLTRAGIFMLASLVSGAEERIIAEIRKLRQSREG